MFPMEIITLLGSGLMGGIMSLWGQSIKARDAQNKRTLDVLAAQTEAVDKARQVESKPFQFTRRILALMSVFAVIVLPKLVAIFYPEVAVTVGYTEFDPGFWFFTESKEIIKWQVAHGLTLTPLDTHFVSAVAGLYFGASIIKNA